MHLQRQGPLSLSGQTPNEEMIEVPPLWIALRVLAGTVLWIELQNALPIPANGSGAVLRIERKREVRMEPVACDEAGAACPDMVHCTLVGEAPVPSGLPVDEGLCRPEGSWSQPQLRLLLEPDAWARTLRPWLHADAGAGCADA